MLGEIFLNAFLLRRVYLISDSIGDAVLIGSNHSSDTLRLREFLARNGQPHTGQYRWFLARGVPLRDSEGHIVRWYGTNTDIEDN